MKALIGIHGAKIETGIYKQHQFLCNFKCFSSRKIDCQVSVTLAKIKVHGQLDGQRQMVATAAAACVIIIC